MDEKKSQRPNKQTDEKKRKFFLSLFDKMIPETYKEESENNIKDLLKKIGNFIKRPEIIMAILTSFLVIIAWQQNRISRDLTEISNQTLKISNRAYIVINDVKPHTYFMDNNEIIAKFVNSGNTPAYNVRVSGQIKLAEKEFAEITASPYTSGGAMVGKDGNINITEAFERQFTANEKIRISKKEIFVFYIGHLTYNDIFGDFHCIEFCAIYDPAKGEFGYCSKNNEPCTYIK